MLKLITTLESPYWAFAPSGRQLEEAAKVGKKLLKEAPKYADDVARVAAQNSGFFQSIPTWVWVIVGIVAVVGIGYWIYEES